MSCVRAAGHRQQEPLTQLAELPVFPQVRQVQAVLPEQAQVSTDLLVQMLPVSELSLVSELAPVSELVLAD